jgi:hypothetical protein
MRVDNPNPEQRARCFRALDARARQAGEPVFVKYLDLGTHVVRLINHSAAFTPHVEKQLTWSLKDKAPRHDATLVIWQDRDLAELALSLLNPFDPEQYRKLRLQKLSLGKATIPDMAIFDEEILRYRPLIEANKENGVLSARNPESHTDYYAAENLHPEEFIKQGHLFVQNLFCILKSPTSSLVHGAVVGLRDTGVLFCAIGYRGKSTLTVNCLLDGFDYVSDDYLVLGKNDGILRAWPIYSVIALSPMIYQAMYHRLQAKFVSNNARKDKYMFNIAAYHDRFRSGYPVKVCMFPQITDCAEPSIVPGDKEKAIGEFISSSLGQMGEAQDVMAIGKLYSFVEQLPFYRFNLSPNLDENTRCLREFLEHFA